VDCAVSSSELRRALSSDIIYLAGGNTFYFLKHLRKAGLIGPLREFAARGGVLAGLSAGALIMSPNIGLAGYPHFDSDENEVGLSNLSALDLVGLEFFPHYEDSPRLARALAAYSHRVPHPVYACRDGGGIVVDGEKFEVLGRADVFYRGEQTVLC